ncbi:uncharacterized protein LOC131336170 [Rhododendron vialii]|uniref:uncharacterized protein LOC131336170 n=1 Tax=Rhododendron vialii TaxID=182163 RepID=UPI00265EB1B2|nr:uncharacterized protein LOC131336170 [Rhododendron vialii]
MEVPWDALDLDDSDLPSLLRPCKRQTHHHHHQQKQPLDDHNHNPGSLSQQSPRIIPGPAGAVQAAMLRKALANRNPVAAAGIDDDDAPVTTQEYIRRALEDGEDDDDFNRNPWLSVLEFLGHQGAVDSLDSIKKCRYIDKLDQVVAIIKTCTPNGLGDLIATLKDPTGTIDASIHHKVLDDVELGKHISVGSVLILQKVAVFVPCQSAHCLNITVSNVAKVISKDSGPLIKQGCPVSVIRPVRRGGEYTGNVPKVISLESDRIEGIVDNVRQSGSMRNPAQIDKLMDKGNPTQLSGHCGDQNGALGALEIMKKTARIDCIDDDQRGLEFGDRVKPGGYQPSSLQHSSPVAKLAESQNDQDSQIINGTQNQRQTVISKAFIPEWTDEQLNELFAAESDDGYSIF